MATTLSWVKEAFSREVHLLENGVEVGRLHRAVFERDVAASLHAVQLRYDVTGFLFHSVNVHDMKANNRVIATITLHFGKRAELRLENGTVYTWKRHNMLMREWTMIREGATDADDKEVVNYSLTRKFLADHGDISTDLPSPEADIVVLTGLFIRNYFQRRRRAAAAGAA
ncbi:hypothetical protein [uncultured Fibrella sp.]|uniref:hypothetical protein n=1 Tax=uncultured Fibrella sp. TaxID=1284596 RepID=UPI0035CAA1B8